MLGEAPNHFKDPVEAIQALKVPSLLSRGVFFSISQVALGTLGTGYTSHELRGLCDPQKPKEAGGKPVSDQWIPPFVIVDEEDRPVGPIQASSCAASCCHVSCAAAPEALAPRQGSEAGFNINIL